MEVSNKAQAEVPQALLRKPGHLFHYALYLIKYRDYYSNGSYFKYQINFHTHPHSLLCCVHISIIAINTPAVIPPILQIFILGAISIATFSFILLSLSIVIPDFDLHIFINIRIKMRQFIHYIKFVFF